MRQATDPPKPRPQILGVVPMEFVEIYVQSRLETILGPKLGILERKLGPDPMETWDSWS